MNDLEMNATAEGLFRFLQEKTESPVDGIAVIGTVLLMIFDNAAHDVTIAKFAEDFRDSLVESWNAKSSPGPGTLQ